MTAAAPLKALTVRQPWAFAIAEGFKPIENRTRRTHHRGDILLHTSRQLDGGVSIVRYSRDAARRLDQFGGRSNFWDVSEAVPSKLFKQPATLALTGIIGTVRIVGCHYAGADCLPACEAWGEPDAWHWELTDARPLPAAVPVKGALGLWTPDDDVQQAVRNQQAAALRSASDLLSDGAEPAPDLTAEYPDIDDAVAALMVTAAVALEHGAVLLDTPKLLAEAHRLNSAQQTTTAPASPSRGSGRPETADESPTSGAITLGALAAAGPPQTVNPTSAEYRRHAVVFNALTQELTGERHHVLFSARQRATRAVLEALASELAVSCPTPETHLAGCLCDLRSRTVAFRETADRLEACNPHINDAFAEGVAWAVAELRRQADHTARAAADTDHDTTDGEG